MEILSEFAVMVPLVVGLVAVLRKVGMPTRFAPVMAIVFGVLSTWFFVSPDTNSVMQGIMVGLSASGLWSGVKTSLDL